jgi:hypothetical protein
MHGVIFLIKTASSWGPFVIIFSEGQSFYMYLYLYKEELKLLFFILY